MWCTFGHGTLKVVRRRNPRTLPCGWRTRSLVSGFGFRRSKPKPDIKARNPKPGFGFRLEALGDGGGVETCISRVSSQLGGIFERIISSSVVKVVPTVWNSFRIVPNRQYPTVLDPGISRIRMRVFAGYPTVSDPGIIRTGHRIYRLAYPANFWRLAGQA